MLKKIFKNYSYLLLGQGISGFLYFCATIYLARKFGVGDFGKFSFAESVFLFFSLIALFGSDVIGTREVAQAEEGRKSEVVSTILSLRLISGLIAFCLLAIFVGVIRNPWDTKGLVLIFGFAIFSLIFLLDWYFWGQEEFGLYSGYTIIRDLIFLIGVVTVSSYYHSILWVGIFYVASRFIFSLLLYRRYLNFWPRPHLCPWGQIKKEAIVLSCNALFWVSFVGWIIHYFDIALLSIFFKANIVGYYSAAYKPIFYAILVISIYLRAIFPILSKTYRIHKNDFLKTLTMSQIGVFVLFFPLAILGFIFSKNFISLIYGPSYALSVGPFQILIFIIVLMSINMIYSQGLLASGRERQNLKVNLFIGASNIVLNLILIPLAGITGAAWSKLLSQVAGLFYYKHESVYKA